MKKIVLISVGLFILTSGLFIGFHISGKTNISEESIHNIIQKETDEIYDSLVKIRRDIHMYPELSEHEKRTSEIIESYLRSLGLEVKTNIGGYGVIGILKGIKDGKHIAWRADIDAYNSDFPDVVEFESKNKGVQHICGHDVHTVIGLGIATVLSKQRDKINGSIYFIFQPAEEVYTGAKRMIDDGLFTIINPSEIYALHISPLPVGTITAKENEVFAYRRNLKIKLKGISNEDTVVNNPQKQIKSHDASDEQFWGIKNLANPQNRTYNSQSISNKDAFIKYVQNQIKSYNTTGDQFWDMKNLTDPQMGIFNPQSIYKNYLAIARNIEIKNTDDLLELSIKLFGTDINVLDSLPIKIKETIKKSPYANNLESVDYMSSSPTVNNNSKLTQDALNSLMKLYGKNSVISSFGIISDGRNDDFAYFQQHVPGVYFFLGGSNSMPHSSNFTVDEECIKVGVKYFSSLIFERMKKE